MTFIVTFLVLMCVVCSERCTTIDKRPNSILKFFLDKKLKKKNFQSYVSGSKEIS